LVSPSVCAEWDTDERKFIFLRSRHAKKPKRGDFAMHAVSNYPAGAAKTRSTLELTGITGAQAEWVLAAIWRILETYSLASPIVEVAPVNGQFDISLTFGSAKDCALVENCLPNNTH
jgi:hypothetical protein